MEQDRDTSQQGAAQQTPPPLGPSPEVRQVLYRALAVGAIMILGGIFILAAVAGLISGLTAAPAQTGIPVETTTPLTTVATVTVSTAITTQPIPTLPPHMRVVVSVEKNSAGNVIVYFNGGEGRSLVKQIEARLTRSDGTVVTGTMDPLAESPQVTLAGTKTTEHVAVYALMYSGKRYLILEQSVSPPIRAGSR